MKIEFTTKKPVFDDIHGYIQQGEVVDMPDHKANFYMREGLATSYLTKVMQDRPCQAAGTTEPLSASPVAQALPQTTVNESANGVQPKKRGRKKKEA